MACCCLEPLTRAYESWLQRRKLSKQYYDTLRVPFMTPLHPSTYVVISVMTDRQLAGTYRMMLEAVDEGQGYSINEFGSLDNFRKEFKSAHKFAITMATSEEHVASLILTASRYSRGVNVVDPYIIVKAAHRGQGLGSLCVDLSEHFSGLLGYLGLYVDTFSNNENLVRQLERREGYSLVGTLPAGGVMPDGTVIASLIYYKDLRSESEENQDNGGEKDGDRGGQLVRDFNGKKFKRKRDK